MPDHFDQAIVPGYQSKYSDHVTGYEESLFHSWCKSKGFESSPVAPE